jgi:hypothetical protein
MLKLWWDSFWQFTLPLYQGQLRRLWDAHDLCLFRLRD